MKRIRQEVRKAIGNEEGIVSIEFAIISIMLILLTIGVFDFGRYAFEMTRVESAARAGTQSGIRGAAAALDTDAIIVAARNDLGTASEDYDISARRYCACAGTEVDCSTNCSDGIYAPMYTEVTVTGEHNFLFSYPSVNNPAPVASVSRLRVR